MAQVLGKKPKVSLTDQKQELTRSIEEYSRQRLELLGDRFEQLGIETHEMNGIWCAIAEKADGEHPFNIFNISASQVTPWSKLNLRDVSLCPTGSGLPQYQYLP